MVCIPYAYGVKCAYSQVKTGLQGTLLVLNLIYRPSLFFFFRLPHGDPPKKRKKQRAGRSKYVLPLKGTKGAILGLMRIDHSAKQKHKRYIRIYCSCFELSWQRFRLCLYYYIIWRLRFFKLLSVIWPVYYWGCLPAIDYFIIIIL